MLEQDGLIWPTHHRKEPHMFKVSVMYPNNENARFDFDYYRTKHMGLVKRLLKPFGLVRTEVLKGISGGGGQTATYICIGNLYFETADGYEKGVAAYGGALRADIPNFTNVAPIRQISEIVV
ncbi:MAG: EthD family reductase [Desulfobacteraceae bacterium]|nr:MAG: EthD family reductase [Desulfobacteraceae bacterium]